MTVTHLPVYLDFEPWVNGQEGTPATFPEYAHIFSLPNFHYKEAVYFLFSA